MCNSLSFIHESIGLPQYAASALKYLGQGHSKNTQSLRWGSNLQLKKPHHSDIPDYQNLEMGKFLAIILNPPAKPLALNLNENRCSLRNLINRLFKSFIRLRIEQRFSLRWSTNEPGF